MTIAIYGSRRQNENAPRIVDMIRYLASRGVAIVMHAKLFRHLMQVVPGQLPVDRIVDDEDDFSADVALSIGGDGTFLRTARWVGRRAIPIAGINTGHLGYLAAFTIDDIDMLTRMLLSGEYRSESRTLLRARSATDDSVMGYALNEVAVIKTDDASMMVCNVTVNNASPARYQADGVLVSTPTGSTGYNLSVGGPIIAPTASVWVISPIAAHSLTMRPLVVGDDNCITIETSCRARTFLVSLDGYSVRQPAGATILVDKAPFITRVIQQPGHTFTDTLRTKLLWGV